MLEVDVAKKQEATNNPTVNSGNNEANNMMHNDFLEISCNSCKIREKKLMPIIPVETLVLCEWSL